MLSSKLTGVLAIVACTAFLVLIGFQVWEFVFYGQPPSVWPTP